MSLLNSAESLSTIDGMGEDRLSWKQDKGQGEVRLVRAEACQMFLYQAAVGVRLVRAEVAGVDHPSWVILFAFKGYHVILVDQPWGHPKRRKPAPST